MSRRWEKFFFIFTYITQGSHYMSPRAYAIMHRLHHAYTDTKQDPHSPNFSSNIFSMMLRTRRIYTDIFKRRIHIEDKFTKNLPEWEQFDSWANSTLSRALWVTAYVVFFIFFVSSPWQYLLLPVIAGMGALHGAIINWFAHKFGYRNFALKNTSENLFTVDILMLGESYHNNHHKRPSSINFGVKWHELDPVYLVILLFDKLGVIDIPKVASLKNHTL